MNGTFIRESADECAIHPGGRAMNVPFIRPEGAMRAWAG
jgi:hypothetical protein